MSVKVTFEEVKNSEEIKTYIKQADASLEALGYTEHSFAHAAKCAATAGDLLQELGYGQREVELARIAGYMHDIGNVVNRSDHAQSGALMAFRLLDKMGMDPEDAAAVVTAIGHHDEATAFPVNAVAAALILADKTDVRRSRVRNKETIYSDIHDRVNYAVEKADLTLDLDTREITLHLTVDTAICSVLDYFEIFMQRTILSRRAAGFLGLSFKLNINNNGVL